MKESGGGRYGLGQEGGGWKVGKGCGYLVYHKEEAEKNRGFIELFQIEGKTAGFDFFLVGSREYKDMPLPDVVINRTREPTVSQWYERRGVPVFHSSFLTEIGNNKWKTLQFFKNRLPASLTARDFAPVTAILEGSQTLSAEWFGKQGWGEGVTDLVLKTVDGHGGSEVRLAERATPMGLKKLARQFPGRELIVQRRVDSDSKDVRVYILGGEIYQAMLRQGKDDFRSNFSLGGSVRPYHLSGRQRGLVECFLRALKGERIGLLGLDFILDREGELIFNELEEMVGCRMLYQYTERNIVRDFVSWLCGGKAVL